MPAIFLKHPVFSRPSSYLFKDSGYLILLDSSSNMPAFGSYFKYSVEFNDFYLPEKKKNKRSALSKTTKAIEQY